MKQNLINKNAIELLKEVTQKRNWHQGKLELRHAAATKSNLHKGKLSYEKACSILYLLGWQKAKEETWKR